MVSKRFLESLALTRRVIGMANPSRFWAASVGITFGLVAMLGALPPLFTGRIIDALQALDATHAMYQLGIYVVITLLAGAATFGNGYASTYFREAISRNLRVHLMNKLLHARLDALEAMTLGEIANRVNDIDELCTRFEYSLFPTISGLCTLIATSALMLVLDWRFAIVSFVAVAFAVVPTKLTTTPYTKLAREQMKLHDELTGALNECATLSALTLLRNKRAAARELLSYTGLADRLLRLRLSSAALSGVAGFGSTCVNLLGPIAVLALGAALLLRHEVSVGTIVTFLMYQSKLYGPFAGLSVLPLQLASIGIAAERVLQIADLEEERSGNVPFVAGDVQFRNVSVLREGRTIVDGADVTIPLGTHAAIVGPSGSGKSTLAMLLLRLHDPSAGSVRIGNRGIAEIDLTGLRDGVAVVSQDPLIIDTSLLENLTYTNPGATPDMVERVLRLCRLGEVVERLPQGLQTRLGQRGFRLSGGERQRICLARALLQNPDILVLDEALTGVDVEMEAHMVADLRAERDGRTLIVITHRLGSINTFNPIVVVENGKVSVQGSHAQAAAACAWYASSCEATRFDAEVLHA